MKRSLDILRAILKKYGPRSIKKLLWDQEFSGDKWDFIDNTAGDCVYPHLEKYAHHGSILDLGCGPGNTANEVANGAYEIYVGVDISEAALEKGRRRTVETGRAAKNTFVLSDFLDYAPTRRFDVILFRESMYHVPMGKIKPMLDRLGASLTDTGVFMVRMAAADVQGNMKSRPTAMFRIMQDEFDVIEKAEYGRCRDTVIVFRPRHSRRVTMPETHNVASIS
jgi:SAM-dependent methyltransferase